MKFNFLIITLVYLVAGVLVLDGGGSVGETVLPLTNPFPPYKADCGDIFLNITFPVNGSDFYFPGHTLNVTWDLQNVVNPFCEYKLVGGSWNSVYCAQGGADVNNKVVTMPEGYPQVLTLQVTDNGCWVEDSVEFNVWYRQGLLAGFGGGFLPLVCLTLISAFLFYKVVFDE